MSVSEAHAPDTGAAKRSMEPEVLLLACVNAMLRGGEKLAVSGGDARALYRLSKIHGLQAIVFDSLSIAADDTALLAAWSRDLQQNFLLDLLQRQAYDAILAALRNAGIRCLPLKGIAIKDLYPKSCYRATADLDFFMPDAEPGAVARTLAALGYTATDTSATYDTAFTSGDGVTVEIHSALVPRWHPLEPLALYLTQAVRAEGDRLYWSPEDEYLYLLAHLAKHYEHAGVGVRQVLDIFLYQQKIHLNLAYVRDTLARFSLLAFYNDLQALIACWFGEEPEPSTRVCEMAADILSTGSYGTSERALRYRFQKGMRQGNSRFHYALRRLLPGQTQMRQMYPLWGQYAIFFPALWAHRLLHRLVTRRAFVAQELRLVWGAASRQRGERKP